MALVRKRACLRSPKRLQEQSGKMGTSVWPHKHKSCIKRGKLLDYVLSYKIPFQSQNTTSILLLCYHGKGHSENQSVKQAMSMILALSRLEKTTVRHCVYQRSHSLLKTSFKASANLYMRKLRHPECI